MEVAKVHCQQIVSVSTYQALSQTKACENGKLSLNVFCSNSGSQIQGDENAAST